MRRLQARVLLILLVALLLVAALPLRAVAGAASAPAPATLLLAPADLPPGYVSDDALENADATARTAAYRPAIVASAFAGYRTAHAAVIQYVALLRRRSDAALVLAHEATAVTHTRGAARLTLASRYGDGAVLAYQQHGARSEEWTMLLFADGRYLTILGAYDASGEQPAINLVQRLAGVVDPRLRAAARLAPAAASTTRPATGPALRIVTFTTTTRQGRISTTFHPRNAVYWRVVWRVGRLARDARETLREVVRQGRRRLYHNGLTDRPYSGDNVLSDHLQLGGSAPGRYRITITITIGRLSARATRTFRVVAS